MILIPSGIIFCIVIIILIMGVCILIIRDDKKAIEYKNELLSKELHDLRLSNSNTRNDFYNLRNISHEYISFINDFMKLNKDLFKDKYIQIFRINGSFHFEIEIINESGEEQSFIIHNIEDLKGIFNLLLKNPIKDEKEL